MATDSPDAVPPRRRCYDAALDAAVDADRLDAVTTRWVDFVRRTHGDVFERADADPGDCARDALYYDFLVSRVLTRTAAAADVTVRNPGPDADAFPASDLHRAVVECGFDPDVSDVSTPGSLASLYHRAVSRSTRRVLGEYYTPGGLASLTVEAALDADGLGDPDPATVLDPGCGAGAFLVAALGRQLDAGVDPKRALDAVVGVDVNPVAVRSAKAALLLALGDRLAALDSVTLPVHFGDGLGIGLADAPDVPDADAVVCNPPWVPWERLPERAKARWRAGPIDRLDLFERCGADARLGFANDDVALLFALTSVDRHLRPGGRAAFVCKRDALVTPTGELLRRGRVGDRSLAVTHVHDFGDCRPFRNVDAGVAVYALDADATPEFPVPTTCWRRTDAEPAVETRADLARTLARTETALEPVRDDPASAWVRRDTERRALGPSAHEIRHGLKDDAKDVFSLSDAEAASLEPDHVFPYLRSKHVVKFGLFGHDRHLVPERRAGDGDPDALASRCPKTHAYLESHRDALLDRGSSWFDDGPFYSLFGLGPYTWADYKVVWCRLGFKPHFAVVSTVDDALVGEKPVVPGDHCMFVATDDGDAAHYLCALLNAAPYQRCLRRLASGGKASLSKSVVSELRLPDWDGTETQRRLAALSRRAHDVVPDHVAAVDGKRAYNDREKPELDRIRADVDRLASAHLDDLT